MPRVAQPIGKKQKLSDHVPPVPVVNTSINMPSAKRVRDGICLLQTVQRDLKLGTHTTACTRSVMTKSSRKTILRWEKEVMRFIFSQGGGNLDMTLHLITSLFSGKSTLVELSHNYGLGLVPDANAQEVEEKLRLLDNAQEMISLLKLGPGGGTYTKSGKNMLVGVLAGLVPPEFHNPNIASLCRHLDAPRRMVQHAIAVRSQFVHSMCFHECVEAVTTRRKRRDAVDLEWVKQLWHSEPFAILDSFQRPRRSRQGTVTVVHQPHYQLDTIDNLYKVFIGTSEYKEFLERNPSKRIGKTLFHSAKCFCVTPSKFRVTRPNPNPPG
jgi:hypothetical protein